MNHMIAVYAVHYSSWGKGVLLIGLLLIGLL
jgi:hypothetical protein